MMRASEAVPSLNIDAGRKQLQKYLEIFAVNNFDQQNN